ncbi:MAG: hypothetical protein RI953_1516 [Pseudomonadota bacterium]|jgi:hypothetical protein
MKSFTGFALYAVCFAGFCCGVESARAESTCQDLLVQLVEPEVGDVTKNDEPIRRVTVFVPCDKGAGGTASGAPSVLHFMERSGSTICVSERTCGNVRTWQGYFGLAVGWSELRMLGDYHSIGNFLRYHRDWNGNRLVATFSVGKGQIERDCSELSRPTCVDVMK